MEEKREEITIAGTVKAVLFRNEENGYTVLKLDDDSGEELTAVGTLPLAAVGEDMLLGGAWMSHKSYGRQFKAEWAQRRMPSGAAAIYAYLASRAVKGVGPATASILVNRFGDDTLDVLENHPEKLSEIRGISYNKAREISLAFRRQAGVRRLMEFLTANSLPPELAMRLFQRYGDEAMETIKENPYIITTPGIGVPFAEADRFALSLGMEGDSPQRVSSAVLFELRHNANNGHTFIPVGKLVAATAQLIDVDAELAQEAVDVLQDGGELVREDIAGVTACYLAELWAAESYAAQRLLDMAARRFETDVDVDRLIERIELEQGMTYAEAQRDTLRIAARRQVAAITGGPGTGKTTSVRAILALFDLLELDAVLAAPTGRAAKRMSELTGREASTVHRLLGAAYSGEHDELVFKKNESDPLKCGAVILDECSMVDITLIRALLLALPLDARLILVGDADQLPSVGPGNVFGDILRSGVIETVRLTEIFRQKQTSRIVTGAHMINRGERPDLRENTADLFFLRRREPARAVDTVLELCQTRLPQKMGIPFMDIQVLTPTRKGETGTVNLNARLQERLNPASPKKREKLFGSTVFREGDRVMQIQNDYDIMWKKVDARAPGEEYGVGVFNGDVGQISEVDITTETLSVIYDGREAEYTFEMLNELDLAYAMTVHKSQGSEYRAVLLCVEPGPFMLMHRGLLYTAVTRASELLVIVGDDEAVYSMIANSRQTRRYSGLRARLAGG